VLLWCFNVSNHYKQRTEGAILTPYLHKRLLVVSVLSGVVVRVLIIAKEQRLPDKVNSVRAAAEAPVSWIEVVKLASHCRDRGVVVAGVIKYKATQRT
jgi:hypothetical protein